MKTLPSSEQVKDFLVPSLSSITVNVNGNKSQTTHQAISSFHQSNKVISALDYEHDCNKPGNAGTFIADVTNALLATPYHAPLTPNIYSPDYSIVNIYSKFLLQLGKKAIIFF